MSHDNIKIYKNPLRDEVDVVVPYTPHYKLKNISVENGNSMALGFVKNLNPNKSLERVAVKQPYAEASEISESISTTVMVPNVGNSMEHTWSSVDDYILDDLSNGSISLDPNQAMIDNNDYLNYLKDDEIKNDENISSTSLIKVIEQIEEDSYLLLLYNEPIYSGTLKNIEEHARTLIFGDHELNISKSITIDDIMVIKKVRIKVGLFLE